MTKNEMILRIQELEAQLPPETEPTTAEERGAKIGHAIRTGVVTGAKAVNSGTTAARSFISGFAKGLFKK